VVLHLLESAINFDESADEGEEIAGKIMPVVCNGFILLVMVVQEITVLNVLGWNQKEKNSRAFWQFGGQSNLVAVSIDNNILRQPEDCVTNTTKIPTSSVRVCASCESAVVATPLIQYLVGWKATS
jgi:hypothetical protein